MGGPTRLQLESLETYLYLFFYFSFLKMGRDAPHQGATLPGPNC